MPLSGWWTLTRGTGFVAYAATTLSCGSVWLKTRLKPKNGIAALCLAVAIFEFFFCLDMVFEWRLALHSFCGNLFMTYNLYDRRRPIQAALLFAAGCILLFAFSRALRHYRDHPGALLAVSGVAMSVSLWVVEVISLHETDAVLYFMIRGLMVVGLLWSSACLLTLLGIGIEARSVARDS